MPRLSVKIKIKPGCSIESKRPAFVVSELGRILKVGVQSLKQGPVQVQRYNGL